MSASPAERTPGNTPGRTPNGNGPAVVIRRPKAADPLMRPKPRKPAQRPAGASKSPHLVNGSSLKPAAPNSQAFGAPRKTTEALRRTAPPVTHIASSSLLDTSTDQQTSGFAAPQGEYQDYPLKMGLPEGPKEGLRYHVARFAAKKNVDITNDNEFTRPLRLHRRDPRAPAVGIPKAEPDARDVAAAEERDRQEQQRQQRAAQRELDMADVAPSQHLAGGRRPGGGGKKNTQQVLRKDETTEQIAASRLKYEEALPWHLEDFDNKQAWVGSYEAALSETYAQITFDHCTGVFHIAPLEKWYKFTQKRNFGKTEEEIRAELLAKGKKKQQDPDFLARHKEAARMKTEEDKARKAVKGLFLPASSSTTTGSSGKPRIKREDDAEEIDFEEQEADDEEDPLFEGEVEDAKETEARIKRDQINANAFNLRDEKTYDEQDLFEKWEQSKQKQDGKKLRRALKNREKNFIYDSDSDHPYSSSVSRRLGSSGSQSLTREQSDSAASQSQKSIKSGNRSDASNTKGTKPTRPPSGASTKGHNTPSHRHHNKHLDPAQRLALGAGIKRNGSPSNASELSGNESGALSATALAARKRKKAAKGTAAASLLGTGGTSTPNGPPSRPRSPLNGGPTSAATRVASGPVPGEAQRKGSFVLKRPRAGAASGSDGEGAGSAAETSDGGRKKRRLKVPAPGSAGQSPVGSRAGSPERASAVATASGSRAASPGAALRSHLSMCFCTLSLR